MFYFASRSTNILHILSSPVPHSLGRRSALLLHLSLQLMCLRPLQVSQQGSRHRTPQPKALWAGPCSPYLQHIEPLLTSPKKSNSLNLQSAECACTNILWK